MLNDYEYYVRTSKRQLEMNAIPWGVNDQYYQTVNGKIRIAEITSECPKCGSLGVWTYCREPELWRCVRCNPMPKAGEFIKLYPETNQCPSCKHIFCILSKGVVSNCSRYERRDIGNDELIRLSLM